MAFLYTHLTLHLYTVPHSILIEWIFKSCLSKDYTFLFSNELSKEFLRDVVILKLISILERLRTNNLIKLKRS